MALHAWCLLLATLLTLTGVWMCWHASNYRMHVEEAMKDGKLTMEQVNLRLRFMSHARRFCTLTGMALLVVILMWATR